MSRMFKVVGNIVIFVGLCGLLYWFLGQRIPVKVAYEFLDAIQSKDWEAVTKLLHPVERERLGLTNERMKSIGENLLLPLWQRLGAPSGLKRVENPFQPTHEEEPYFRNFHFFRLLRGDKEGAVILVVETKEGWRINFSLFAYTLLTEAAERGLLSREQIRPVLLRASIFQIFVGQESIPLPP